MRIYGNDNVVLSGIIKKVLQRTAVIEFPHNNNREIPVPKYLIHGKYEEGRIKEEQNLEIESWFLRKNHIIENN